MKNVLELVHQTTNTKISFCYGDEAFSKYIKKQYKLSENIESHGCTLELIKDDNGEQSIVIGVKEYKDIYALKALVVHELSHAISHLMKNYNFNCDEFRSYTLQWLYVEVMPYLDEIINND